jgi:TATA-box binding protein (TBP) (component of TFIID and TFIIIB)
LKLKKEGDVMSKLFSIIAIVIVISASLSAGTISQNARHQITNQSMKIQQQFSTDLDKLLDSTGKRLVRKFKPIWAKNVEVFSWANYNINSNSLTSLNLNSRTGDIVVTGAYVLEDASMAVGGYFEKTGESIVIASKAFQFKAKTKRATYFEPKKLNSFILKFSHLHKQRDIKLKRSVEKTLCLEKLKKPTRKMPAQIHQAGTVEAISIQNQTASVMVNNKLLLENEMIDGIRIADIKPNKVTFERSGKQWTQTIGAAPIVKW